MRACRDGNAGKPAESNVREEERKRRRVRRTRATRGSRRRAGKDEAKDKEDEEQTLGTAPHLRNRSPWFFTALFLSPSWGAELRRGQG